MANQLTVGQRFDVYEVVSPIFGFDKLLDVGGFYCGKRWSKDSEMIDLMDNEAVIKGHINEGVGSVAWPSEVRKCGYYLKVKEIKK